MEFYYQIVDLIVIKTICTKCYLVILGLGSGADVYKDVCCSYQFISVLYQNCSSCIFVSVKEEIGVGSGLMYISTFVLHISSFS